MVTLTLQTGVIDELGKDSPYFMCQCGINQNVNYLYLQLGSMNHDPGPGCQLGLIVPTQFSIKL